MHRRVDEIVPLYVAFRTPFLGEDVLKAYLERLAINLEAFVLSTVPPPEPEAKAPPPKEVVYSETIKTSNEPIVICYEDEDSPHMYVVWKVDVFICKMRHDPTSAAS